MKSKRLVTSAMFTALTFVATMVIQIRLTPNGYVNIGDCMVCMCGIFLGPVWGALSAGIGSCLADLISGFVIYAPATFIVKSVMALSASFIFKRISNINNIAAIVLSSLVCEVIMCFGYYLYELMLYGNIAALASMAGNLLQMGFGFVCSIGLYLAMSKNRYIKNINGFR